MITLNTLPKLIKKRKQRVGRGEGSNRGKNAGKGHKGQIKRAGKSPVTFEGGRRSLVRRLPKVRGFKQILQTTRRVDSIGISLIQKTFDGKVTVQDIIDAGLVDRRIKKLRIYKNTDKLTKKIEFDTDERLHLTAGVKELI